MWFCNKTTGRLISAPTAPTRRGDHRSPTLCTPSVGAITDRPLNHCGGFPQEIIRFSPQTIGRRETLSVTAYAVPPLPEGEARGSPLRGRRESLADGQWPSLRERRVTADGQRPSRRVRYPRSRLRRQLSQRGSDPTAAGGGKREGSDWQRSARNEPALPGEVSAGHRNRRAWRTADGRPYGC